MGLETRPPPEGRSTTEASEAARVESRAASSQREPPAPAASDLLPIAAKANDLEAIKKAVDDAASVSGGLWLSYLFVLFYLAVAARAVTHADLFLENPVKLPFLGVELPLLAFFLLAPIIFLVVHAYVLLHLVMLTDKAKLYHRALRNQIKDKDIRDGLRRQLPSNVFVQFLAGAPETRRGAFGGALRVIGWTTLVVGPVLLLLLLQLQFLPYHNSFVTWTQRLALFVDLILMWWLWGRVLSGRAADNIRNWRIAMGTFIAFGLSIGIFLFSALTVYFPGELQEGRPTRLVWSNSGLSLNKLIFNSPIDGVTGRRRLPFSNTLVLTGFNIYEGLKIDDPDKLKGRNYVFRARGRDLNGAIFNFAVLPKVDFDGAKLLGASLNTAQLQGASLYRAQLQGASLDGAQLQRASLDGAQLQGASLGNAQLQGGSLDKAQLQGASLKAARLQGASLLGARLQGASLDYAQLQGASLTDGANFDGASLDGAELEGAWLEDAQLQGASLIGAQLQGASLIGAQLQGASLDGAQLQGASLDYAQLQGASLDYTQLQGASLHSAQLQGATLQLAFLEATDLSYASLWRSNHPLPVRTALGAPERVRALRPVRLREEPEMWRPSWRDHENETHPWNDEAYQDLRQKMESIPQGDLQKQALEGIQRLDCATPDKSLAACDPAVPLPPEAAAWQRSMEDASEDNAPYFRALAATLKLLVCSGREDALYVLRGLLHHALDISGSRPQASGAEAPALIDFIMSKDCPVSASLTGDDKLKLLNVKLNGPINPGH